MEPQDNIPSDQINVSPSIEQISSTPWKKILIIIFIILFILTGLYFFSYFYLFSKLDPINLVNKAKLTGKAGLPTSSTQQKNNQSWEKQYIDLYGIEIDLPKGWIINEVNRRGGEEGVPSLYGHDCADYEISSPDSIVTINLRPVCTFAEGLPNPWPDDTVIVDNKKNPEGSYLVRFFLNESSAYVYTYGAEHEWEDNSGMNYDKWVSMPAFIGVGNNSLNSSYLIGNSVFYSGPKEKTEEYLKIVDKIILSLKTYKNTVTIPPTPTPYTFNWLKWNSEYGFSLQHPPDWSFEKECTDITGVCWNYFRKPNEQSFAGSQMTVTVNPSWSFAGFEEKNIPTKENNNFWVSSNNIPAWIYRDALQAKDETKTDHYEDRLYFELNGKVFHIECFHDRDPQFIETCNNIFYNININ